MIQRRPCIFPMQRAHRTRGAALRGGQRRRGRPQQAEPSSHWEHEIRRQCARTPPQESPASAEIKLKDRLEECARPGTVPCTLPEAASARPGIVEEDEIGEILLILDHPRIVPGCPAASRRSCCDGAQGRNDPADLNDRKVECRRLERFQKSRRHAHRDAVRLPRRATEAWLEADARTWPKIGTGVPRQCPPCLFLINMGGCVDVSDADPAGGRNFPDPPCRLGDGSGGGLRYPRLRHRPRHGTVRRQYAGEASPIGAIGIDQHPMLARTVDNEIRKEVAAITQDDCFNLAVRIPRQRGDVAFD